MVDLSQKQDTADETIDMSRLAAIQDEVKVDVESIAESDHQKDANGHSIISFVCFS